MQIRILRKQNERDTWKQKTLNTKKLYIINEGKIYEIEEMCPWMGWGDFYHWIETMTEVK